MPLSAEAGPNYDCLYADIGANCRCHNGGLWSQSCLSIKFQEKKNLPLIPKSSPLSIFRTTNIPYVFVGDILLL